MANELKQFFSQLNNYARSSIHPFFYFAQKQLINIWCNFLNEVRFRWRKKTWKERTERIRSQWPISDSCSINFICRVHLRLKSRTSLPLIAFEANPMNNRRRFKASRTQLNGLDRCAESEKIIKVRGRHCELYRIKKVEMDAYETFENL